MSRFLVSLAVILIGACSGERGPVEGAAFLADPGRPERLFGPKCWGDFQISPGGDKLLVDGTAYSHSRDGRSHLFLELSRLPPGLRAVYFSFVYAEEAWSAGVFSEPRAGRAEIVTAAGARYLFESGPGRGFYLRVAVAAPAEGEPSHYLTGQIVLRLERDGLLGDNPGYLSLTLNSETTP